MTVTRSVVNAAEFGLIDLEGGKLCQATRLTLLQDRYVQIALLLKLALQSDPLIQSRSLAEGLSKPSGPASPAEHRICSLCHCVVLLPLYPWNINLSRTPPSDCRSLVAAAPACFGNRIETEIGHI